MLDILQKYELPNEHYTELLGIENKMSQMKNTLDSRPDIRKEKTVYCKIQ